MQKLKAQLSSFNKRLHFQWANKLPNRARWMTWLSLMRSRFTYGLSVVAHHFPPAVKSQTQFLYCTVKNLLQINIKPKTEDLLQLALGMNPDTFVQKQNRRTQNNIYGITDDLLQEEIKQAESRLK